MEKRNRIKELREELGLSQQALGERVGMFQESVGRMERSKSNRVVETWIRTARALNKTVEEIYHLPPEEIGNSA